MKRKAKSQKKGDSMQIVIDIPKEDFEIMKHNIAINNPLCPLSQEEMVSKVVKGIPIPKGHGRLKDEDEIIKAIEDRVEFLRENDAIFRRLRKDIDILGCIPKIRCEVPTIIEADKESEEEE